jgi:hypothetical protein
MVALVTILAVAVGLLAVLVVGLLRSHAEILRALHELGAGLDPSASDLSAATARPRALRDGVAPDITGVTPSGETITLAVSGVRHLTLVAFLSSTCLTCRGFWDTFGDAGIDLPGNARLVLVTKGPETERQQAIAGLAPAHLHTVLSSAAWDEYGVPGAPFFTLIDGPSGAVIGEGTATTWDKVTMLMSQSLADAQREAGASPHRTSRDQVDDELQEAGIDPGHASLYPEAPR